MNELAKDLRNFADQETAGGKITVSKLHEAANEIERLNHILAQRPKPVTVEQAMDVLRRAKDELQHHENQKPLIAELLEAVKPFVKLGVGADSSWGNDRRITSLKLNHIDDVTLGHIRRLRLAVRVLDPT